MDNVKIPRSFVQPPFDRWYRALVVVSQKSKNKKFVLQYFLQDFSSLKEEFYVFVLKIKKYLKETEDDSIKKKLAQEYLAYISILCERFGFFEEKSEVDDIAFKITNPEAYERIKKDLATYKLDFEKITKRILRKLRKVLRKNGFKSRVSGRYKSLYSIYKKNHKKQKKSIFELNDIFAFRVVVNGEREEQCFLVLNFFNDQFTPVPKYFKNYIDIPKINGYKSLHTGLNDIIPNFYLPVEVQIRTKTMDEYAEKGLASHWLYSQNKKSVILTSKEKKLFNPFLNEVKQNLIFCFSHKGEIFQFKRGSNIIDFAAKIHSDFPSKVCSASVNGEMKTTKYEIKSGDVIHLIIDKKI